jgi:hypothetical protein
MYSAPACPIGSRRRAPVGAVGHADGVQARARCVRLPDLYPQAREPASVLPEIIHNSSSVTPRTNTPLRGEYGMDPVDQSAGLGQTRASCPVHPHIPVPDDVLHEVDVLRLGWWLRTQEG